MINKIKFFIMPYYIPDNYSPEVIALGEGFLDLGINISANVDCWLNPETGNYLFSRNDEDDYDVAIYDSKYLYHSIRWTLNRVNNDKINILMDRNDWLYQDWRKRGILEKFDVILIDHMIRGFDYPDNVKPWSIGLTNRIISYSNKARKETDINLKRILTNSRVPHNLRKLINNGFENNLSQDYELCSKVTSAIGESGDEFSLSKIDRAYSQLTSNRHDPCYFNLLNEYLLTNAVGGYYDYKPCLTWPYTLRKKIIRKPYYYIDKLIDLVGGDFRFSRFVFQYDSFRFWEVMYSCSCPIHLDYDYWGFILPVQPINGVHYLGIKDLSCKEFSEKIKMMSVKEIREIGENGRRWSFENYSPVAVSKRLLNLIDRRK